MTDYRSFLSYFYHFSFLPQRLSGNFLISLFFSFSVNIYIVYIYTEECVDPIQNKLNKASISTLSSLSVFYDHYRFLFSVPFFRHEFWEKKTTFHRDEIERKPPLPGLCWRMMPYLILVAPVEPINALLNVVVIDTICDLRGEKTIHLLKPRCLSVSVSVHFVFYKRQLFWTQPGCS